MNITQLNLAWKTSSHDERNQFINDYSIGSIDISDTASIELFKVENENIKEFNGHLKISKESYESLDGSSGKLIILSLSSLVNLESLNFQDITVNKVKQQMDHEGLELLSNGNILTEVNSILPTDTSIYQWNAKTTENSLFFNADYTGELLVKVFSFV